MDLEAIEKSTAKPGWVSRILGLVSEVLSPTQEPLEPMPAPPEIQVQQVDDDIQLEGEGFGKLFGRIYDVRFKGLINPTQLIRLVEENMASLGPEELVIFEKPRVFRGDFILGMNLIFQFWVLGMDE